MKLIKAIFYSISFFIMFVCACILICALNPKLTNALAKTLYKNGSALEASVELPSNNYDIQAGINTDLLSDLGEFSYLLEEDRELVVPLQLEGKNGYAQILPEEIVLDETEAALVPVDEGEIPETSYFDERIYPYYAMLQSEMRKLYSQIYSNAMNQKATFTPCVATSVDALKNVYESVLNDHPELFWLDSGFTCKYQVSSSVVEITLKFNETIDRLEDSKRAFEESANDILMIAQRLPTIEEQEKYVHDALVVLVDYDDYSKMNQSAYSALVNHKTVCAGYARAFQYLMQRLNIPCYYCTGFSGEDHAWNIVEVNSNYANVDVTWDDTEPSTYDFYNKSDEEYADTHRRTGLSRFLPFCERITYTMSPLGEE